MNIFLLNLITYIETSAYISGKTFTTEISSFFIFFIFVQTLGCAYGKITIFQLNLNVIFLKARKINIYFVGVIFFFHISLHNSCFMFPVKFSSDIRESEIIHKIIK